MEYNRLAQKPREECFVIVDVSPDRVLAGVGVQDVLRRPTVDVPARVGKRQSATGELSSQTSDFVVGPALDELERSGEVLEIIWPISVGQLDEKGKGKQIDGVCDWPAFEALLFYVLFTALGLPARPFAYHLHLSLPAGLAHQTHETITQICFERLHLPALLVTERPLLAIYAVNAVSGTVVEIGQHSTEVHVVHDSLVIASASTRSHVGQNDLDNYLCYLILSSQPDLPGKLGAKDEKSLHTALQSIVQTLRDGDFLSFASAALSLNTAADGSRMMEEEVVEKEETLDDIGKVLLSGNVNTIIGRATVGGQTAAQVAKANVLVNGEQLTLPNPIDASLPSITIGAERHRFAEPLFDPSVLGRISGFGVSYSQLDLDARALSVQDAVAQAIRHIDLAKRYPLWETMLVIGPGSAKGVPQALAQAMAGFMPQHWGKPRLAQIPVYFPEFKGRLDLVTFLGGSIVAKIGFLDSTGQFWVNKADYSASGPCIVSRIEKPPAM